MKTRIGSRRLLRARLLIPLAAGALIVGLLPSPVAAAGIVFDGSPGANPPPATLGGYSMTPFGPDGYAFGQYVTSVPAPGGGSVGFDQALWVFSPASSLGGGWTPGYTGNAYVQSASSTPLVLTLPAGTKAFYLYAENDNCGSYWISATANDGTSSGMIPITGVCSGPAAKYFGFYTTGSTALTSITLVNGAPAYGLIVGQFGINVGGAAPAPKPTDPPKVMSLSPGAGKVGSLVTILGTSFSYANKVTFNGVPASFTVKTPGTIVATVPRGATTGPVTVTTPFGSAVSARSFFVLP